MNILAKVNYRQYAFYGMKLTSSVFYGIRTYSRLLCHAKHEIVVDKCFLCYQISWVEICYMFLLEFIYTYLKKNNVSSLKKYSYHNKWGSKSEGNSCKNDKFFLLRKIFITNLPTRHSSKTK